MVRLHTNSHGSTGTDTTMSTPPPITPNTTDLQSSHHPRVQQLLAAGWLGSNLRIPLLADPNIRVARSTEDSLVKDKGVMFCVRYLTGPVGGL